MNRYNDPSMYDYHYYPKKLCLIFQSFIILITVFIILGYFSFSFFKAPLIENPTFLKILFFIIWIIIFFLFIVMMLLNAFFAFRRRKKISIGINKDGLFVRYAGFFTWNQVIDIKLLSSHPRSFLDKICIRTTVEEDLAIDISFIRFMFFYYILDKLRIDRDGVVIITECDTPIALEKLKKILEEYKAKYSG